MRGKINVGGRKDRKSDLLRAAVQLLQERGSSNFTLNDLADVSGSNGALVKYYFGNKEGLLTEVYDLSIDTWDRLESMIEDQSIPPEEKLKRHIHDLVFRLAEHSYLGTLFLELTSTSDNPETLEMARQHSRRAADAHARLLAEGYQKGVFKKIDPMYFYLSLVGAAHHAVVSTFVLDAAFNIKKVDEKYKLRLVEYLSDMFLASLKPTT